MNSKTISDNSQCPECGGYGDKFIRTTATDIEGFVVVTETTYHHCGYCYTQLLVDDKKVAVKSS